MDLQLKTAYYFLMFALFLMAFLVYDAYSNMKALERRLKNVMASNRIARTVIENKCEYDYYDENNDKQHGNITVYGNYATMEKLERRVRHLVGNSRLLLTKVTRRKFYTSESVEEWIKHAEIIRVIEEGIYHV